MLNTINFPNLGIELESVGRGISFLGIEISFYGLLMALAIIVGTAVIMLEARYTGQHIEDYLELVIVTVPAAVLGARLYYIIFGWGDFKGAFFQIFAMWKGGFAFYGGLIAGIAVIIIYANFRNMWTAEVLDTVTLGVLAGQVIASWGSYYNRESFGEYTDGLFAMQLPIETLRVVDVTDKMRNYLVEIEGVKFVQVQPVFLYQSIWCLLLLIGLFIYRYHKEFDGEVFCLYIAAYSLGRVWMDGMRTDALPLSRIVAFLFMAAAIAILVYNRRLDGKGRMRRIRQKNAVLSMSKIKW